MTDDQADKIIKLLETLEELAPIIETLGEAIVFRKCEADEIFGLNKQTLSKSNKAETFDEIGARRVYVNLKSLVVYRAKRKRGEK